MNEHHKRTIRGALRKEIARQRRVVNAYINPHDLCTENPRMYRLPPGTWRDGFAKLWDSINAKRGHPFSANDWVFVYELQQK